METGERPSEKENKRGMQLTIKKTLKKKKEEDETEYSRSQCVYSGWLAAPAPASYSYSGFV